MELKPSFARDRNVIIFKLAGHSFLSLAFSRFFFVIEIMLWWQKFVINVAKSSECLNNIRKVRNIQNGRLAARKYKLLNIHYHHLV